MRVWDFLTAGCAVFSTITPVAFAQTMPQCAVICLQNALRAQSACGPTETACICSSSSLLVDVQGCVQSSCTVVEGLTAQNLTQTLCGAPVRDISHIPPIVTATSGAIALLMIVLRMFAVQDHFALDDMFATAAMASAIPMGVLEFIKAKDGFGKDIWTIPAPNIYRIVKLTWLTEILYSLAVIFTKLSFLFFCLRIFPGYELRLKVYTLIAISIAFGFAFTITTIFNCTPVSSIWTKWDGQHSGKCINFHVFAWVHAALSIVLDILMIGVPIPELLRLSLSTKKKVFIIMMFGVGTFTTIVAIIRLQSLVQFASSTNPTYENVPTAYWSDLEVFVGICCICMPSTRRFLARRFPRFFGSMHSSSNSGPSVTYKLADKTPDRRGTGSIGRDWGIMKTIETTVKRKGGIDDEIQLVESTGTGHAEEGSTRAHSEIDTESSRHWLNSNAKQTA
ncbi:hypothetical protein FB567DRAFT_457821 [Paraphoma chrysanthemicola]|uniref:CFEM domain-containing protein n=1 Tax=Paraphoma chrysanthemicola TaxID=798071 RepID=A0A8K0QSJ6_9PLEO|nr:hypothetical protein FB567DRAFT_457821 [Paraphoma chrysanthemicola]